MADRKDKVGIVGIGDMGSGLAKNLLQHGFDVFGFDLSPDRMKQFADMGGRPASTLAEVAHEARAVYVMVMTGAQAKAVIFDEMINNDRYQLKKYTLKHRQVCLFVKEDTSDL